MQKWVTILQKIEIITVKMNFILHVIYNCYLMTECAKTSIVRSLDTDDAIKSVIK